MKQLKVHKDSTVNSAFCDGLKKYSCINIRNKNKEQIYSLDQISCKKFREVI